MKEKYATLTISYEVDKNDKVILSENLWIKLVEDLSRLCKVANKADISLKLNISPNITNKTLRLLKTNEIKLILLEKQL